MSRTLTISDELYARLEAEARERGMSSIERLLEERERTQPDLMQRRRVVNKISGLRNQLSAKYGMMPDSVELVREDRNR